MYVQAFAVKRKKRKKLSLLFSCFIVLVVN